MQVGNVGANSPYAGNQGDAGGGGGADNSKASQDLQDQKSQNAEQEELTKASNLEAKRNQTRMSVIANLK